jgi:ATP-dependent Zn protease
MSQDLEDDAFHDKTSREDVAYHEAGHAVARWRHDYDRPVDKVTVKPGRGISAASSRRFHPRCGK